MSGTLVATEGLVELKLEPGLHPQPFHLVQMGLNNAI